MPVTSEVKVIYWLVVSKLPVVVLTNLSAVKPEKVMLPLEVIPVAAVIAPESLMVKPPVVPTVNREPVVVVPIETFPVEPILILSVAAVENAKVSVPARYIPVSASCWNE